MLGYWIFSNTEKFVFSYKLHVTNNNGIGILCSHVAIYNKIYSTAIMPGGFFKNKFLTKVLIMELWEIRFWDLK